MDDEMKLFLGKILGEIYRIQRKLQMPCSGSEAQIYGLLNGLMTAVNTEIQSFEPISENKFHHVVEVLNSVYISNERMDSFKGYYEIEPNIEGGGVSRVEAAEVIRYLKAENRFVELIAKMDTANSPGECRTFEILDEFK